MNSEIVQMIITLLGGLAVFIYGMNLMSDGLQKAAGEKMKNILALLTRNPLIGVLAGAVTTAVLQSSSATTVMVIGFVSAGLMTLKQAISVIMGANIGTTITAQLIAFQIGDYAWAFVIIGFVMFFFFSKKEKVTQVGQVLFGFGLLFIGINVMGDTMEPLAASPCLCRFDAVGKKCSGIRGFNRHGNDGDCSEQFSDNCSTAKSCFTGRARRNIQYYRAFRCAAYSIW